MSGNRLVLIIIFIIVFILMMIIGLSSGVSLEAGLERAFSAAVSFSALSYGTYFVIDRFVINDLKTEANGKEEESRSAGQNAGQMLDVVISELPEEEVEDIPQPSDIKEETVISQDIGPLVTRQIDPNVEKVINNDPHRIAEIIKKMGFEE